MWQYETPNYQVESSLPSLSLIEQEAARVHPIDKLATQPPRISQQPDISEVSTLPPRPARRATPTKHFRAFLSTIPTIPPPQKRPSISPPTPDKPLPQHAEHEPRFNPLDSLRWWLVRPGRIESLCWIAGTILLFSITSLLFYVTLLSTGVLHTGPTPQAKNMVMLMPCATPLGQDTTGNNCISASASNGLQLIIFNDGPFMTGGGVHVQGQGFQPRGNVTLLHDNNQPCEPGTLQADPHGMFTINMLFNEDWKPGDHHLVINDTVSKRSIVLTFTLLARPTPAPTIAPTATPSPTPLPYKPPLKQPTHPPIIPTQPVQPTPTTLPRPTATPTENSPTSSPTPDASPTSTNNESSVPGGDRTAISTISNVISGATPHQDLYWLVLSGYAISLALLITALLLARFRRR